MGRPFALTFGRGSDRHDGDDPVIAVDDDDLVTDDEVHVAAPLRMNLDQRAGNLDHAHAGRHCCTDREREIDVIGTRHVAAGQHRLPDPSALLGCQGHAAASLALLHLRLARLGLLALLPGLPLRGLPLRLVAPHLARTLRLTLGLVRRLTGGLVAAALVALGLALLLLHVLAWRLLIALAL